MTDLDFNTFDMNSFIFGATTFDMDKLNQDLVDQAANVKALQAQLKQAQQELLGTHMAISSAKGIKPIVINNFDLDKFVEAVLVQPELKITEVLATFEDTNIPNWVARVKAKPLSKNVIGHLSDQLKSNPSASVLVQTKVLDTSALTKTKTLGGFLVALRKQLLTANKMQDLMNQVAELQKQLAEAKATKVVGTATITDWKQQAIELKEQGMKYKDIATQVGKSEISIKKLFAALKKAK